MSTRMTVIRRTLAHMGGASGCLIGAVAAGVAVHAQAPAPRIEQFDPALSAIVSPTATIEALKTDYFGFLEGPVWVPDGGRGFLLFSDVPGNRIYKWDGALSVWMERSGFTGRDASNAGMQFNNGRIEVVALGSNGLTLDREGRLVFATHGDRALKRREKDGTITVLAERYEGHRFNGPNDVVVRADGTIFFTDLFGGLRGGANATVREMPYGIYALKDGALRALDRQPLAPDGDRSLGLSANGLAFSPDEKRLYVTVGRDILRYDVQPDGSLTNRAVHVHLDTPEPGGCDGLKVDRAGDIFVMGPGGVWIVSPAGKPVGRIRVPGANLAFGDADSRGLYIAAQRDLYRVRVNVPGIRPVPIGSAP